MTSLHTFATRVLVALLCLLSGPAFKAIIVVVGALSAGATALAAGEPEISSPTTLTANSGVTIAYEITATNTPTSLAATGLPTYWTIDPATGGGRDGSRKPARSEPRSRFPSPTIRKGEKSLAFREARDKCSPLSKAG